MKKNFLLLFTLLLPLFSFPLHSQIFGFDLQLSQNPNLSLKVFVYPNTQKVQILDGNTTIGIFNYTSWCANNDGVILVEGGALGQKPSFGNQFIIDIADGKYGHSITLSKGMAIITESNSAALSFIPSNNDKYVKDLNSLRDYILGGNNSSTPSTTKIEPYQSNSKNKMSYNGIIVGEDNEIYEGGFVPVIIEFEKEMQSNTETGNIIVKINDRGTSKLYYAEFNKDSELTVTNDYLVIVKCAWSCYSFVVKSDEDWSFVIETTEQSVMNGKILKKYIIAIEDATKEDFRSIISFFKH